VAIAAIAAAASAGDCNAGNAKMNRPFAPRRKDALKAQPQCHGIAPERHFERLAS
jgi:hypothetical protein